MGLFGGGKKLDVRNAENLALQSQDLYRLMFNDLTKQNAPYTQLGAGGADKLRDLLGIAPAQGRDWYKQFLTSGAVLEGAGRPDNAYVADKGNSFYEVRDDGLYRASNTRSNGGPSGYGEFSRVDTAAPPDPSENFGSLLENFTLDDYQESPNFQFNLDQGEKAINRAAAARGDYLSPATVQELAGYSQNLASNEFLNSYNMDAQNKSRTFDMLMGTVGTGQNAMATQSNNSFNYGGAMTDLNAQLGQLDLAQQADKAAKRQSAFSNLASIASLAAAPFTGGTSLMGMATSAAGLTGGFNPLNGITWNSGRVM